MIPVKKFLPLKVKAWANRIKNIPFFARLFSQFSLFGSQAGQDFWVIGEAFNGKKHGFFLDVGAHDGINISNTHLLESKYAWNGICVEANPHTFLKLQSNRGCTCVNACLGSDEREVDFVLNDGLGGIADYQERSDSEKRPSRVIMTTKTLYSLLKEYEAPNTIDYLSIDIEGAEEEVLVDFPFDKYQFNTMTIERPSDRLRKILEFNGYILVREIPNLDSFYIHSTFRKEYKHNLFSFYKDKRLKVGWK